MAPFGQTIEKPDLAWTEIQTLGCMTDPPCGLQIIGTERHEARRIDRQLRGRSGRQGDPGATMFFLSLEDDLMRLFGSDRIAGMMDRLGAEEGEVITHPLVTRNLNAFADTLSQVEEMPTVVIGFVGDEIVFGETPLTR